MTRRIVMAVGFCVFVAAFFLPAVFMAASLEQGAGKLPGWLCAVLALYSITHIPPIHSGELSKDSIFLALSGLINPLVLLYLVVCIWPSLQRLRWTVAGAIGGCLAATWAVLYTSHSIPLIGHYLWVAGILTMLAAGLLRRRTRMVEKSIGETEFDPETATGSVPLNPQNGLRGDGIAEDC